MPLVFRCAPFCSFIGCLWSPLFWCDFTWENGVLSIGVLFFICVFTILFVLPFSIECFQHFQCYHYFSTSRGVSGKDVFVFIASFVLNRFLLMNSLLCKKGVCFRSCVLCNFYCKHFCGMYLSDTVSVKFISSFLLGWVAQCLVVKLCRCARKRC